MCVLGEDKFEFEWMEGKGTSFVIEGRGSCGLFGRIGSFRSVSVAAIRIMRETEALSRVKEKKLRSSRQRVEVGRRSYPVKDKELVPGMLLSVSVTFIRCDMFQIALQISIFKIMEKIVTMITRI